MAAKSTPEYPELVFAMFECTGEGLYAINAQGEVLLINPAACRMLGYQPSEIIGKVMHDTTHYKRPDGSPFPKSDCAGFRVISEGETVTVDEDYFIRKDQSFVPVSYTSSPIMRDGRVVGAVVAFQDISSRLQQEDRLRKVQEHQRLVYRASQIGTWEWNVDSDLILTSTEVVKMLALPAGGQISRAQFEATIFYDSDRQLFENTLRKALRTNKEFKIEFRIRGADGVRWLLATGKSFFNRGSTIILGVLIDITELKARANARSR
jgi:PAS domain S-box-containing protein